MDILDAHHHLWDTRHLHYSLLENIPALNRPYTMTDFETIIANHGILGSVCVEAASAGADGFQEIRWLIEQTKRSSKVVRLVAWAPLEGGITYDYLERLAGLSDARIVGVRRSFEFEPPDYPRREEVIEGVKAAARYGYSLDLVLYQSSLCSVIELVKSCPEVDFILDHLGKPNIRQGHESSWRELISELAQFDNITCKISGLPSQADHELWSREQLKPYILYATECFGWDRVMFGSDWPVSNLAGGYRRWLETVSWAVSGYSEPLQRKLFFENAWRIYKFD